MSNKRPYGQPIPPNPRYDFEAFIERVKLLDLEEIRLKATGMLNIAEAESYGRPGAVNARESGSLDCARRARNLLAFLNLWVLPESGFYSDSRIYKEIAESLVGKGQLKKEVLDLFK